MRENFLKKITYNEFWAKKIAVVFAMLLMVTLVFGLTGCGNKDADVDVEIEQQELDKDTVNFGNDGVNGAIAPDDMGSDDVTLVSQQDGTQNQSMVAMSIEDAGRADPFLPYGSAAYVRTSQVANYNLELPPETITADPEATEVMTTKVSGIMYDKFNPSAILNIKGSDYLVRAGDVINNYKVLSIAKEYVTVQFGANVYKAGVGEIFTDEGINYNTVSNLQNKFGGNRKK